MSQEEPPNWSELIIERSAFAVPLSDDRYRAWMAGRRIFVSSAMDSEMSPFRNAVRDYLRNFGATPVMWEEITPQDQSPQVAYLSGVESSRIFLLLLGRRYGIADDSGYSPTNKEANLAKALRIPRLLFTFSVKDRSERDGKLNDLIGSLHNELSAAEFETAADLCAQLDSRLREMAAHSERLWIKLGRLIFPGRVSSQFRPKEGGVITVTARISEGDLKRELIELGKPSFYGPGVMRLTYGSDSHLITVKSVNSEREYNTEDFLKIICEASTDRVGDSFGMLGILSSMDGKTPSEVADIWARRTIFSEEIQTSERNRRHDFSDSYSIPETKPLAAILHSIGASAWVAEGLTQLFIVEEVSRRYGGHFEYLEIGPSTAKGLVVKGKFRFPGGMGARVESAVIEGFVAF